MRLDLITGYETAQECDPFVTGPRVFMAKKNGRVSQVLEYSKNTYTDTPAAQDISRQVPTFLSGKPIQMAGDETLGFFGLLTDNAGVRKLFSHNYHFEGEERVQSAWGEWIFKSGTLLGIDTLGGTLGLVFKRADGIYLETVNLDVSRDAVLTAANPTTPGVAFLDRRVRETSPGVTVAYNAGTDTTTWTLPYSVAVDGSEGTLVVGRIGTGAPLVATRPSATTIAVAGENLSVVPVFIGVLYKFYHELSPVYLRDSEGRAKQGRLTVRTLTVRIIRTSDLTITVTPYGRTSYNYALNGATPDDGNFRVPVYCRNEAATIALWDETSGGCRISGVMWEGTYHSRSRSV